MTDKNLALALDLETLLERGRGSWPVDDIVRARALARARATIAATPSAPPMAPYRGRGLRMALVASMALAVGATGASAAFHARSLWAPAAPSPVTRAPIPAVSPLALVPSLVPAPSAPQLRPASKPRRLKRVASAEESCTDEVDALQRAQAACARQDFLDALMLIAEDGRRHPNGCLSEEREALRVRSLLASGRASDARRVGAAFTERFPRSVLLARLQETLKASEPR
ncbi:MAG TPA: hypothetical protein VGP07_21855 [Polyangia bacterium]|jgi:hypothetical protein